MSRTAFAMLSCLCLLICAPLVARPPQKALPQQIKGDTVPGIKPGPLQKAQDRVDRALDYLKSVQKEDGSWQGESDPPAMTAIVIKAFLGEKRYDAEASFLNKAVDKLLSYQKPDGGIYKDTMANYNTSIAVSALAGAKEAEYQSQLDKAVAYLKKLQWNNNPGDLPERKQTEEADAKFGGWGYGKKERPDGSNLQIAMDALKDAGIGPNDPAFKSAIKFVTRMQNLSETNDQPWAGNDGGFIYTPALGGESFAGEYTTPDGKRMLRSYGSMTYAGLKSFIYAGLTKDDPRVQAAWKWISQNWTLDENPGMKAGDPANARFGLYYYYMTLARALNAYDEPIIRDSLGSDHDWRVELIDKLAMLQQQDGSWVGDKKWMEDNPVLTTAYCVLALQETIRDLQEHPVK